MKTTFEIGDRVGITGTDHPWRGASGEIVGRFDRAGLEWRVRLDHGDYSGQECAASSSDLRPDRRRWVGGGS